MARGNVRSTNGLGSGHGQVKSGRQFAGTVGGQRRRGNVVRRPLAHPAHALGAHRRRELAVRNVLRQVEAREGYLFDHLAVRIARAGS